MISFPRILKAWMHFLFYLSLFFSFPLIPFVLRFVFAAFSNRYGGTSLFDYSIWSSNSSIRMISTISYFICVNRGSLFPHCEEMNAFLVLFVNVSSLSFWFHSFCFVLLVHSPHGTAVVPPCLLFCSFRRFSPHGTAGLPFLNGNGSPGNRWGIQICERKLTKNIVFYREWGPNARAPRAPVNTPYHAESLFLRWFVLTWKRPNQHGTMENWKPQARARLVTVTWFLHAFCSIPLSLCFPSGHASTNFNQWGQKGSSSWDLPLYICVSPMFFWWLC